MHYFLIISLEAVDKHMILFRTWSNLKENN